MNSDDVITVAQIAEILNLNQQTVRNWIKSGNPDLIHYLDFPVMRTDRVTGRLQSPGASSRFA